MTGDMSNSNDAAATSYADAPDAAEEPTSDGNSLDTQCYGCGAMIVSSADYCPHCSADQSAKPDGTHHADHSRAYPRRHRVDADDLDRFAN